MRLRTALLSVAGLTVSCGADPPGGDPPVPVVHTDAMVARVPASEETVRAGGPTAWEVWRSAAGMSVLAVDHDGDGDDGDTPAMEVLRSEGGVSIAAGGARLVMDVDGTVVSDTLGSAARRTLAFIARDVPGMEHSALTCLVSLLAIIGSSAACGSSGGAACLGLPAAFCGASKQCGSNVCGL